MFSVYPVPAVCSGLIKYSELTEYLVRAVTSMQKELAETRQEADQLRERCAWLEAAQGGAAERAEEQRRLQEDSGRLRQLMAGLHRDLLKLKDEKCELYGRYAAALEEKSAVGLRCRDLNLQVGVCVCVCVCRSLELSVSLTKGFLFIHPQTAPFTAREDSLVVELYGSRTRGT